MHADKPRKMKAIPVPRLIAPQTDQERAVARQMQGAIGIPVACLFSVLVPADQGAETDLAAQLEQLALDLLAAATKLSEQQGGGDRREAQLQRLRAAVEQDLRLSLARQSR